MRFGYARVSTREQSADHQLDALRAAGIDDNAIFIEKISRKLSSRPKLDQMLSKLRTGDQVTVTRLRRIGRNQAHLLELVRGFGELGVDFVVLEQGIDTATPGGRLVFHFLAALAEYDREMIVEGTRDGLAAARARGRVGGRPPALTPARLDQAQVLYDSRQHTVTEIADSMRVGRSTLYRQLAHTPGDCVLVVYRNRRPKRDPDTNRPYGETGASETTQRDADREWFPVAPARQPRVRALVYVVDGVVARVRAVARTAGQWTPDPDRPRFFEIPVGSALTKRADVVRDVPGIPLNIGDTRPHVRGRIREYLPLT